MIKKKIVTIVGAGVIGAGWAARMLACGLIVNAYDPSVKARKQLLSNTKTALKSLQRLGLNKNAKLSNLKIYSDLRESLHSTTFVQENAPENEKLNEIYFKDTVNSFPTRKCEVETQTNQVLGLEVKNREADKVYILGQGQRLTKNLSQMLDTGLDWVVENRFRY